MKFQEVLTYVIKMCILHMIMLTNRPTLVKNVTCIPGISDHEKVDWNAIRKKAKTLSDAIVAGIKGSKLTVETAWFTFRDGLLDIQEKEVPFKKATRRFNLPWISNKLKQQVQKKHWLYSEAKGNREKMHTFKCHKAKVQYEAIRSAHWDYVNYVLKKS